MARHHKIHFAVAAVSMPGLHLTVTLIQGGRTDEQSKLHAPEIDKAVRDVFVVGPFGNALHLLVKPLERVAPGAPHGSKVKCINGHVLQHVSLGLNPFLASVLDQVLRIGACS